MPDKAPPVQIRRLPASLINRIAAGEVVERPAAVVKELVENALDAGATRLDIQAGQGGRTIRVADNGRGIPAEELPLAFENHATSKIVDEASLDNIATLGFRGEALASISAVSRVSCKSRTPEADAGTQVSIEGGSTPVITPVGCAVGTILHVEDLFYNTPARLKFLKRPATEMAHVEETLQGLALSRPDVRFTVTLNGKGAFQTSGSGNAAVTVTEVLKLGPAATEALNAVEGEDEVAPFTLNAVLADPTEPGLQWRSKQKAWWLLLNGRLIKCPVLLKAIEAAFEGVLEERVYPLVVLDLRLPPDAVDVNVHPTKREVRYARPNEVFSFVRHQLREALSSHFTQRLGLAAPPDTHPAEPVQATNNSQSASQALGGHSPHSGSPSASTSYASHGTSTSAGYRATKPTPLAVQTSLEAFRPLDYPAPPDFYTSKNSPEQPVTTDEQQLAPSVTTPPHAEEPLPPRGWRVIGQLYYTYILLETRGGLMIVDQHIASERYCYERLKLQSLREKPIQQTLLTSEPIPLSRVQLALLEEHRASVEALGFDLEVLEAAVILKAVPVIYPDRTQLSPQQQLLQVLEQLESTGHAQLDTELLLSTLACHTAIRAGDTLTQEQMTRLVEEWLTCHLPWTCPHGRPIAHTVSSQSINSFFHRPSLPVNANA